jgi:hypothetical protein
MKELTICYELYFDVGIRRHNNKEKKSYAVNGTGINYDNAVWDIYFILKKRRCELLRINNVKVKGIAFALGEDLKSVKVCYKDHPMDLPEDLNLILNMLPKK